MAATSVLGSLNKSSSHTRNGRLHIQDQHITSAFRFPMSIMKASLSTDSRKNLQNKDSQLYVPSQVSYKSLILFPHLCLFVMAEENQRKGTLTKVQFELDFSTKMRLPYI